MSRICKLPECGKPFDPTVPHQAFCSQSHANRLRVRLWKAKHRKKGGGGGNGGGNGGGGAPTLFDELVPVDPQAVVLTDTCYRTPPVPRKPAQPIRLRHTRRAA
jgi:hypothetical protein